MGTLASLQLVSEHLLCASTAVPAGAPPPPQPHGADSHVPEIDVRTATVQAEVAQGGGTVWRGPWWQTGLGSGTAT